MIKVAVIGLGKMGLLHASLLNVMPEARLVAVCEKKALIRHFAPRILKKNVALVDDISRLKQIGIDAAFVATPASSHFPIVKQLYKSNITSNIFVEKPLAINHKQSQELTMLASEYGGVNMVGYDRRFGVTFLKAREVYFSGELGKISKVEGYAYTSDFVGSKRSTKGDMRGGVLNDLGCHTIDLALWFFGTLSVNQARMESIVSLSVDDTTYFAAETGNGISFDFRSSWCEPDYRMPEIGLTIVGTQGKLTVNDDKLTVEKRGVKSVIWHRHDLHDQVPFFLGGAEYYREDEAFIRAVTSGSRVEPDFASATNVNKLIDKIREKAEQ